MSPAPGPPSDPVDRRARHREVPGPLDARWVPALLACLTLGILGVGWDAPARSAAALTGLAVAAAAVLGAARSTGRIRGVATAAALAGGVDIVQLRDKGSAGEQRFGVLEAREELEILARLRAVTSAQNALLSVNDRADIARLQAAHAAERQAAAEDAARAALRVAGTAERAAAAPQPAAAPASASARRKTRP